MSSRCTHCHKGVGYGHAVSHAKNRTNRLFKPNLQKIKVFFENRQNRQVVLCTSCIQRLKKDSHLGPFSYKTFVAPKMEEREVKAKPAAKKPTEQKEVKEKTEEKKRPEMDISDIVGKKE